MGVEYGVSLTDHDWLAAAQHKFIPSVIAAIQIAVTFSGSTSIHIRSGKHSSSTAYLHALDFQWIVELEEFKDFSKTSDGSIRQNMVGLVKARDTKKVISYL